MRQPGQLVAAGDDLIKRLDDLAERIDRELEQSSATLALLRQGIDHIVFAGMVPIPTGGIAHLDWTVPFASLAIADPNGAGPLVLSTDGGSGQISLGQIQLALNDAACVPLHGRYADVTSLGVTGTPNTAPVGELYLPISANGGPTTIYTGGGVLQSITITAVGAAETITFFDGANEIYTLAITTVGTIELNLPFSASLRYTYAGTTAGSLDVQYTANNNATPGQLAPGKSFFLAAFTKVQPFFWGQC